MFNYFKKPATAVALFLTFGGVNTVYAVPGDEKEEIPHPRTREQDGDKNLNKNTQSTTLQEFPIKNLPDEIVKEVLTHVPLADFPSVCGSLKFLRKLTKELTYPQMMDFVVDTLIKNGLKNETSYLPLIKDILSEKDNSIGLLRLTDLYVALKKGTDARSLHFMSTVFFPENQPFSKDDLKKRSMILRNSESFFIAILMLKQQFPEILDIILDLDIKTISQRGEAVPDILSIFNYPHLKGRSQAELIFGILKVDSGVDGKELIERAQTIKDNEKELLGDPLTNEDLVYTITRCLKITPSQIKEVVKTRRFKQSWLVY